jgi:hypothetical protein
MHHRHHRDHGDLIHNITLKEFALGISKQDKQHQAYKNIRQTTAAAASARGY